MAAETLAEVIRAAVADLTANGYDSAERVAYWQGRIKAAAERTMASQAEMQARLRDAMRSVFGRLVDNGGVLRRHPGVSRFRLDAMRPRLHAELERRVMMSADLIRLNREQSVAKTLQRFAGWASSIPAGGSRVVDKREEQATVAKSMRSLPFEERRVIIDQGHKLAASVNDIVATDAGAVALTWHSHWRQANYNYRPDHKERDLGVYLLRDSWAREKGLVRPGPAGYYEDVTAVAEEPFCRCYATYVYNLRDLPEEMLTRKGAAALAEAREKIRQMRAATA